MIISYFHLALLIIECWRRGSHDWTTVIGNNHLKNTAKQCQNLCQQTNTPDDCEYFTYNPLTKKCWVMKASVSFNSIKVRSESAKDFVSGTKRCSNGNY